MQYDIYATVVEIFVTKLISSNHRYVSWKCGRAHHFKMWHEASLERYVVMNLKMDILIRKNGTGPEICH